MEVFRTISDFRQWRVEAQEPIGHVASLGALHNGHRALIQRARKENHSVVVTIYVNPLQFSLGEDFDNYPRTHIADETICSEEFVDALLFLSDEDMYPTDFGTSVGCSLAEGVLESESRPGHFDGVATVVVKLLNIVSPSRSYFGEKDFQQLTIIRRVVLDLNIPTLIVPVETVREADGLALSSRNIYLSGEERQDAVWLRRSLLAVRDALVKKRMPLAEALARGRAELKNISVPYSIDYLSARDPLTLTDWDGLPGDVVILTAIKFPSARLLDNVYISSLDFR